ncbi:MAG TPA: 16S rRNA (cytidine(1402)-2'-O)-methyltransferase [Acidimicrobiia bacterium]|nr:16S rRNA (cytidine(1402)-2'-O)-methyltransferase [Acidimicrobiia bacterium]
MTDRPAGALVLVGTPIGNLGDLSPRAIEVLRSADVIAAEDTRRTRVLLSHAGIPAGRRLRAVHARNEAAQAPRIVDEVRSGARVAVVTDAGMPGISDPGGVLVRDCLDAGLPVEAVPGPSAALTALVLSGLPADRFVFEGFLPRKGRARAERLSAVARESRTTVLFEAPTRVRTTLVDLAGACGGQRPVAVARELTKAFEEVWRGTLATAASHVERSEPRGEHVIVVGPAPERAPAGNAEVEAAVRAALADGRSARDAASDVADALGVARRRAYEAATRLKESRRRGG